MLTATSAARPRGTRLPRLARRRQLLDAAMEVFVARGYHAAAMDEIAERAGVSKPVLYQHFPGKQELYLALLDESVEQLIEGVRTALRSTTENRQRVTATFSAYFGYVAEHRGTFRLVFESDFANDPAVRERLETADRKCADMVSQVIREDAGLADDEAHLRSAGTAARASLRSAVEVKIGIQSIPRELVVDTDATAEEIERDLAAALSAAGGPAIFALTTQKGGRVLIPADKIAFIEFGSDQSRRVGFGNIV